MTTKGMKRLSIILEALAAGAWVIPIAVISDGFAKVQLIGWVIFIVGIPVSFSVTFLMIWSVDWIIAGFRAGATH